MISKTIVGETMTAKEYINKKEQEELDKLFDEAINEAREKQLKELASKAHEQEFIELTTKLADIESELDILEELYRSAFENPDTPKEDIEKYKQEIKEMKSKYTKIQHKINVFIVEEKTNI